MMLQRLYSIYAMIVFIVLFLIFFVLLLIPVAFPAKFRWIGIINRIWARVTFAAWFMRIRLVVRAPLDRSRQYIFCPNHFSYLDVPAMALNPYDAIFVGKHDMEKIPLFGFMYRKLHITVDRSRLRSRYATFLRCAEALDQGKSLVIFPEGGIISRDGSTLARFKDGPFRLAAEKGIPIVPVTIPDNYRLMPGSPLTFRPGVLELIFHEPVAAEGNDDASIDKLRQQVHQTVSNELQNVRQRRNPEKDSALIPA